MKLTFIKEKDSKAKDYYEAKFVDCNKEDEVKTLEWISVSSYARIASPACHLQDKTLYLLVDDIHTKTPAFGDITCALYCMRDIVENNKIKKIILNIDDKLGNNEKVCKLLDMMVIKVFGNSDIDIQVYLDEPSYNKTLHIEKMLRLPNDKVAKIGDEIVVENREKSYNIVGVLSEIGDTYFKLSHSDKKFDITKEFLNVYNLY